MSIIHLYRNHGHIKGNNVGKNLEQAMSISIIGHNWTNNGHSEANNVRKKNVRRPDNRKDVL